MRAASFSLIVLTAAACTVPATNPCDPAAPIDVQSRGTRIAGVVVDQNGNPIAGVPVGVSGRADTQVSGAGGVFAFENLPPSAGYELVASPASPSVGGRIVSPALTCAAKLDGVVLGVVVPPTSPEVEIVQASGDRSLFAAFGSTGGAAGSAVDAFFETGSGHRAAVDVVAQCKLRGDVSAVAYRVQVRAPFEEWKDAVLSPFPWLEGPGVDVPNDATIDRVDDTCAQAMCAQFAYLDGNLTNDRARCVDVVGTRAGDVITGLVPFGSYQVRILTELLTPPDVRTKYALPDRVLAAPPATAGQMSLVASALLPVVGANGQPRGVGNVSSISAAAGGRFALVEDSALSVIGDGADTLSQGAKDAVGTGDAPQGAFGEDVAAEQNVGADLSAGAVGGVDPVAVLPAGDWVRVVRREVDGSASVQKVFLGANSQLNAAGPEAADAALNAEQPKIHVDPTSPSAGTALRAFSYLSAGGGRLDQVGVEPKDAYVLLYGTSFVLVEQGRAADLALKFFTTSAVSKDTNGAILDTGWAASKDGSDSTAAFQGACGRMANNDPGALPDVVDAAVPGGQVNISLCYDLKSALGEDVDLRDVKVLGADTAARALFSDAANDRLLVASQAALACSACTDVQTDPLAAAIVEVRVGREPTGMLSTTVLDCTPGAVGQGDRKVVLVANHGSGDLSVVEDVAGETRETAVVALPVAPLAFLDDPGGASCADPFVWVIGDDGRVVPVDMRGEPSVPACRGASCDVGTRGRGSVGAVARSGAGPARSLVGGNGILGELGFFRPRALKDAAYTAGGTLAQEPSGSEAPAGP